MNSCLLDAPIYQLEQSKKQALLLAELNRLNARHYVHCEAYRKLLTANHTNILVDDYSDLTPLAVRLFKLMRLSSVSPEQEFKVMSSSGTTSQVVSQVVLDRATASQQSRVLVNIMKHWLGAKRLPMLIIDHQGLTKNKQGYSARGAGVQGLSFLGYDHCYALDENMQIDWPSVQSFYEKHQTGPVLIFGFTFMVWQHFVEVLRKQERSLPFKQGVLLHSGGWKKLQDKAVDRNTFNAQVHACLGDVKVHNFYGMVEQTGSIFVECEQGHLHAPVYADVMIRSIENLKQQQHGDSGLIQVMSALPNSYPGHTILTEDIGRILGQDDCACGRKGRYFEVLGRLPKAEVRGCSDTFQ
ncbi:acyl-protein synthetase [Agarivorans sp. B2Z047]|uniref:LuxE/PaaK family acyltransferase n=1 Tax=Agarivorans sp. B2Z047 TaxID=2652721 RepID=UPI0020188F64|nr:acyl-protein synthetase [Agarivorans sp. B2Z047]UQN41227.1 acyl-protein synthetase [Agarivorans sp. B2Z047]